MSGPPQKMRESLIILRADASESVIISKVHGIPRKPLAKHTFYDRVQGFHRA